MDTRHTIGIDQLHPLVDTLIVQTRRKSGGRKWEAAPARIDNVALTGTPIPREQGWMRSLIYIDLARMKLPYSVEIFVPSSRNKGVLEIWECGASTEKDVRVGEAEFKSTEAPEFCLHMALLYDYATGRVPEMTGQIERMYAMLGETLYTSR